MGSNLYNQMMRLSKEERIKMLKSDNVREIFLKDNNHYPFVWLIGGVEDDELYNFIDSLYLKQILESSTALKKMNAIMNLDKACVNDILSCDMAISYIISYRNLHPFLVNLNYKIGRKIIDFSILHNINCFKMLGYFSKENQLKIFNGEYIIKLLECDFIDNQILNHLDGEVIKKLLSYDKFLDMFLSLDIKIINTMIKDGFVIPKYLFKNNILISKYIKLNTNCYRECVNSLLYSNYEFFLIIESERLKYVSDKINNTDLMLPEFMDYKNYSIEDFYINFNYKLAKKLINCSFLEKQKLLIKETRKQIYEMVIDCLFKDIPYNFLANLKQMLNYKNSSNCNIKINDNIYIKIINFDILSIDDIKSFFNKYKNNNLANLFYKEYRSIKNDSYQKLNKCLLKLSSNIYNAELSLKYKKNIYYLNGEKFNLCIHTTFDRCHLKDIWNSNIKTISLSIIGDKNINYFNRNYNDIIFGFNKLSIDNIMHLSNTDSYSKREYGTDKFQRIYTISNLMDNTIGYNEILYNEKNINDFKPDFLVCFDEIKPNQLEVADYFSLPIVLINSDKYTLKLGLEPLNKNVYLTATKANELDDYSDILKQK